jgi:predicted lipid-binding transport protein (Tim44 family)
MGPVAGLAAGLGLAALASYMGFGEELANMMLIMLMVIVGFIVVRLIMSRMRGPQPAAAGAGAGSDATGNNFRMGPNDDASQYNRAPYGQTDNQGFGASANNWGQPMPNMASSVPQPSQAEIEQFLDVAKGQFTSLQKLWDSGDLNQIKGFCTEAMAAELAAQLSERQGGNHTSVVSLQADWLGLDHTQDDEGHAVEEVQILFHGLIRESAEAAADPFNEVWTLHKRRDGSSGWLLAGITQQ